MTFLLHGLAAVDVYLGATQLRYNYPANLYSPGEFRFGGAHIMEKLVAGEKLQLFAFKADEKTCARSENETSGSKG